MPSQSKNPYTSRLDNQQVIIIPSFTLESGVVLNRVPIAYSTWGELSSAGSNCIVLCHTLTSSSDVMPWWGALLQGESKAFDTDKFFVICLNCLGSPYGSASPCTWRPDTNSERVYGPQFPLTSIRDDVKYVRVHYKFPLKQVNSVLIIW
jgi:homoserine O-acetyltransferase